MAGILFEVYVVFPLWLQLDQSPYYHFYQDWAFGLLYLKIWHRSVSLAGPNNTWFRKFEKIRQDGVRNVCVVEILREIVMPLVTIFGTLLAFPYFVTHGIIPHIEGITLETWALVDRCSYLVFLGSVLAYFFASFTKLSFHQLRERIRDDKYLIGQRLHNHGELQPQN